MRAVGLFFVGLSALMFWWGSKPQDRSGMSIYQRARYWGRPRMYAFGVFWGLFGLAMLFAGGD
jgi:hypothetical protein